jgi:hypothetical protein
VSINSIFTAETQSAQRSSFAKTILILIITETRSYREAVEKPAWAVRQSSLQGGIYGVSCSPGPDVEFLCPD